MTYSNQQTVFSDASVQADAQERSNACSRFWYISKTPDSCLSQTPHAPYFYRSAWAKQEHLTAAVINTDHIRNCMDRPGIWLSEVSSPLIKSTNVSVRDMFYFKE